MIVEPPQTDILRRIAWERAEEARQQSVDGAALGRGRGAAEEDLVDGIDDARFDVAIDQRIVMASEIAIQEVEQFVLDESAANRKSGLQAPLIGIDVGEGIVRNEVLVPVEPEEGSMQIVRSAFVMVLTTPPMARPY